jgi:signal transduction histidine kinase
VRYDPTRKVVLSGADAIVFVADSRPTRREKNLWSLQNLRMNMRAKELDAPILYQINRRDDEEAAPAAEVAEWLGLSDEQVTPAVAVRGEGALETLKRVAHAILGSAFEEAPGKIRDELDLDEMAQAIERAFAPHEERLAMGWPGERSDAPPRTPIVLGEEDQLEGAIETSVRLGEGRSVEAARARRLAREADGFRRLGESLCEMGASTDRTRTTDAALTVARDVLDAVVVSVVSESEAGPLILDGVAGWDEDPLSGFAAGRKLLGRLLAADGPAVIDNLSEYCDAKDSDGRLEQLRSVAAVPIPYESNRMLLAYASRPDGFFEEDDVRFLRSVARHLSAGRDKARAQDDLSEHRERLDQTVTSERDMRKRSVPRRAVDRMRERFLSSVSGEMQSPIESVASAARALREEGISPRESRRLVDSIAGAADMLEQRLKELSRLIRIAGHEPLRLSEAPARRLVEEAIRLAGHARVRSRVDNDPGQARFDVDGLARAVANLIDNAVKFSPADSPVRVRLVSSRMPTEDGDVEAMTLSVADRGPGVPDADRERIFAPFAHGEDEHRRKGLGIGLYEARSLARLHGGTLEYMPRKGGGSDFRLTVPLQPIAQEVAMEVTRA